MKNQTRVEKIREDVMYVASKMQNEPQKFEEAFNDRDTLNEFEKLANDLFSLTEVITNE